MVYCNSFKKFVFICSICLLPAQFLSAQSMREKINNVFHEVLSDEHLYLGDFEHGLHFLPSSVEASNATINSFSNFVSANISSFPLSSTTAGLTFDFSTGVPVATATSLGPIFAERAQTLGSRRFNIGFNFSHLNLAKLRGVNTEDIRFTFVHDDIGGGGPAGFDPSGIIGDDNFGTEFDMINMEMNLDFNASILAFYVAYGVTNRLDISIAVPFVTVSVEGQPVATMNSLTSLSRTAPGDTVPGTPVHFWGDTSDVNLTFRPTPLKEEAVGIGDISFRLKYNFLRGRKIDMAAFVEYRATTGRAEDLLGAGDPSYKLQFILSSIMDKFSPHINLAYEKRESELQRDRALINLGYDQKLAESVTLALDFLGAFETGKQIKEFIYPEPITIQGGGRNEQWSAYRQEVSLTNIPNFSNDNILDASAGLKFTPKENLIVMANVIVPLNNSGLRSDFVPTVGFEFNF